LKPNEIWSLRIRLQLADKAGDLALFNGTIDSKLRGCELVSLRPGFGFATMMRLPRVHGLCVEGAHLWPGLETEACRIRYPFQKEEGIT
jgi:hypothetical protein